MLLRFYLIFCLVENSFLASELASNHIGLHNSMTSLDQRVTVYGNLKCFKSFIYVKVALTYPHLIVC